MITVVAGITYEVMKFSGKHTEWPVMRIVSAPGVLLQNLTTREPDDDQIEVAITAMKSVIVDDDSDKW